MNRLPPEIYLMIFKFLPVQETISLQLVCKKWYHLLSSLKHDSLSIFDLNNKDFYINYNHIEKLEKTTDRVNCKDQYLILSIKIPNMFKSIKKLTTSFCSESVFEISSFYNQFTNLEELNCFHPCPVNKEIILNLEHLKILSIGRRHFYFYELNTPKLSDLKTESLDFCRIKYPEQLKRLEADRHETDNEVDWISFVNLEYLYLTGDWTIITNSFLITLKNLKELHFDSDSYMNIETLNSNFTYRRDGLKIYQFGFNIDLDVQIDGDEEFPNDSELATTKFILKNYDKTADQIKHNYSLDYNELIKTGLPKNFLNKFVRLYSIKIGDQVENEDDLFNFLMKTRPTLFSIENHLPSQIFLDQLAMQCSFIKRLKFKNLNLDLSSNEFDFIFKLENLKVIDTCQPISIDLVITAFTNCSNLYEIFFLINENEDGTFSADSINLCIYIPDEQFHSFGHYFNNKCEMLYFLKNVRRTIKNTNPLDNLAELIFLIEQFKYDKFLINQMVSKLFKNETFFIEL